MEGPAVGVCNGGRGGAAANPGVPGAILGEAVPVATGVTGIGCKPAAFVGPEAGVDAEVPAKPLDTGVAGAGVALNVALGSGGSDGAREGCGGVAEGGIAPVLAGGPGVRLGLGDGVLLFTAMGVADLGPSAAGGLMCGCDCCVAGLGEDCAPARAGLEAVVFGDAVAAA